MAKALAHIKDLHPDKRNARKHNPRNIGMIEKSLQEVGAARSIVIDEDSNILAGNGTIEAAAQAGITKLQVVDADGETIIAVRRKGLTAEQKTRLALFDNRTAETAEWDAEALSELKEEAMLDGMFNEKELAALLPDDADADVDAEPQIDKASELQKQWGTETGQLWQLGGHMLLCGDSTKAEDVERVMGDEMANVCLTDPPYGLGEKKKSGKNNYSGYEDTHENLIKLINGWVPLAMKHSNCVVFSPGVTNLWLYPHADWVMCWFYGGGQLRSSWGYNCWQPFICYGKDPSLASGNGGRPDAIDMNIASNSKELDHPCPKPLALWAWFIERLSFGQSAIFYDPFSGSGTTMIACEQTGRKCRAIEISPSYVAVTLQRFYDATGTTPQLVAA